MTVSVSSKPCFPCIQTINIHLCFLFLVSPEESNTLHYKHLYKNVLTNSWYRKINSINSSFFLSTMSRAFVLHFQIHMKNGLLTFLLTILSCVCSCGLRHLMVSLLPLNAKNWQWLHGKTQKIFHPYFLSLLLL